MPSTGPGSDDAMRAVVQAYRAFARREARGRSAAYERVVQNGRIGRELPRLVEQTGLMVASVIPRRSLPCLVMQNNRTKCSASIALRNVR